MTKNITEIEYDLGDLASIRSPRMDDIHHDQLVFQQYGTRLIGLKGESPSTKAITLAEARLRVGEMTSEVIHTRCVYVACKNLAGAGGGLGGRIRVFSTYDAVEAYLESDVDEPSVDRDDVIVSMMTCTLDSPHEHDPCNCLVFAQQEDALEALEPAKPGPQSSGKVDAKGASLEARDNALMVRLMDGRCLEVPRSWFAFLDEGGLVLWRKAQLDKTCRYIKWPQVTKRVSISALLETDES